MTRRLWLTGLLALVALPAGAETRQARRRRRPRRPQATASREPPLPTPPQIDGPPPPSRIPGLEPAPVPNSNPPQAPLADRLPRPELELGIPTPPALFQGESFTRNDPAPDRRSPPGAWYPSPGATVRLPF